MKKIKLILIVCTVVFLQSCYKPGKISVQNNISQATIEDVSWGSNPVASELLPGETSIKMTIDKYTEKLPGTHSVSFTLRANNKTVYLETEEEYLLEQDDDLLIILDDDTKVANPNQ